MGRRADRRLPRVNDVDIKTALRLALLAKEHVYLEGPPGCGKTSIAADFLRANTHALTVVEFHRDFRAADLFGQLVLRRISDAGSERLLSSRDRGRIFSANALLLDDLSRAPRESLVPLLQVLDRRELDGAPLPLEIAIATALPQEHAHATDPLGLDILDRFAFQLRLRGRVVSGDWVAAAQWLDQPESPQQISHESDLDLERARQELQRLPFDRHALSVYVELLGMIRLRSLRHSSPTLLSDRVFARIAPKIFQAHAWSRGATRVEAQDLRALRYLLKFRVPREVFEEFDVCFEAALAEKPGPVDLPALGRAGERAGDGGDAPLQPMAGPALCVDAPLDPIQRPVLAVAQVEPLVSALLGNRDRGVAQPDEDPAGQPRRYRAMRQLDEWPEADLSELVRLLDGNLPGLPRVYRRERKHNGGRLAILRDVSASMEGRLSLWAGQVVSGLVRVGMKQRMRIGYVEFNHQAERYHLAERFFHKGYRRLLDQAATRRAEGRTNYEAPLRIALEEFRKFPKGSSHIVILTDGVPVIGDPRVHRERALAKRLGVRIHAVFLGLGDFPEILQEISTETGGRCFRGVPGVGGDIAVKAFDEMVAGAA